MPATTGQASRVAAYPKEGDTLVVWELDRPGYSPLHLLAIVGDLRERETAFRTLAEQMDSTTPRGELLLFILGSLARQKRALTHERVLVGLAAARRRGRKGGRLTIIEAEQVEQITAALDPDASKASLRRTSKVARSTLTDTRAEAAWSAAAIS